MKLIYEEFDKKKIDINSIDQKKTIFYITDFDILNEEILDQKFNSYCK